MPRFSIACLFVGLLTACSPSQDDAAQARAADWIIHNAVVYTANAQQPWAEAVAISGDRIMAVGSNEQVLRLAGEATHQIDAQQRMLLPGLHDIHIHPFGLVGSGLCDLASEPMALQDMVAFLSDCLARAQLAEGEWLTVEQWNFTKGNQTDEQHPTLRAALDKVSQNHPIFLRGNDGHHGAANSAALATAISNGVRVGLSRDTLHRHFGEYAAYIGVDADGNPDGRLDESARYLLDLPGDALTGDGTEAQLAAKLPAIAKVLAENGITSIQDAAAETKLMPLYEAFAQSGQQTFRLTAALITDFSEYPHQNGIERIAGERVDLDRLIADFTAIRDRQQQPDILRATGAKIFVDGVLEGNPYTDPPGLPNAAVSRAYQQPRFASEHGKLVLAGYVEPDSDACKNAHQAERDPFFAAHGIWPEQCLQSQGVLEHNEEFIRRYIARLEQAGFAVHAHAIGDRAVALTVDAFARSRKSTQQPLPQTITHLQQINPQTLEQLKESGLFLTFTFAWAIPDYEYDITVTPFIDRVRSLAPQDLYDDNLFAMRYHYPAASAADRGAIITMGSDAPVDTRDPRPFVNLAGAITRAAEGRIYNASERLSLTQALDAFTINGAKALQQAHLTGSLEVGKKADLILLDRDLRAPAEQWDAETIAQTQVALTFFDGKLVFQR